ncbi:hypothetical protein EYZ11_012777 [Aspergillus tanneri]|uniref:Uncharacterized protein n=1 Tax=Aspergillus tanneri TaxID=1220188 RepID=A0A4S3IZC6_9EURO|nr:hypothetical protein EYZ11_012777 [Aspergillus tanneri]
MKACHEGIYKIFEKYKGTSTNAQNSSRQDIAFTIRNSIGQKGVHCVHFLDELIQLIPQGIACFNKTLENIVVRKRDGKLIIKFADSSEDKALL